MKFAVFLLALCLPALATDATLIRRSLIKITSTQSGASAELRGSGLLFNRNGKRYVLTSDHVVAHTNGLFGSHQATSSVTNETCKLKFLAAEWANGLALLEVENDTNPADAIPYAELAVAPTSKAGDAASFYGYPFESSDLTEETFAKLLNFAAPVPYFVGPRSLLELEAAIGEFGMSGGAAFSAAGDFLGVIAYQKILDTSLQPQPNRVYAIPRDTVLPWVDHYFATTTNYRPYFSEPWFAQGDPRQLLLTNDGLMLMFRNVQGQFRLALGHVQQLIILKDGPTIPYVDKRGFMTAFRKFIKEEPWRPSEFAVFERTMGIPVVRKIQYPAEVLTSFDDPKTSVILLLGEKHEERYDRVKPAFDKFELGLADLNKAMAGQTAPQWTALAKDLASLSANLKTMPAKPNNPGAAGANEFFSTDWVSPVMFQIEADTGHAGWKEADAIAPARVKDVRGKLQELGASFKAIVVSP